MLLGLASFDILFLLDPEIVSLMDPFE